MLLAKSSASRLQHRDNTLIINGRFINHEAEPLKEPNLVIGFFNEKGTPIEVVSVKLVPPTDEGFTPERVHRIRRRWPGLQVPPFTRTVLKVIP